MGVWEWPNTIISNIVDGDTVDALVTRDIGFEGVLTFPVRLRLNRINAPKLSSRAGKKCRERVLTLVTGRELHVLTVKGYKYGAPADKTGEYMAEVMLPEGGTLSDLLVHEGLAVYWDGSGPRPADGDKEP